MSHRKSNRGNTFREPMLPDDLTNQLRDRIMALPASVKADYLKDQVFSKFVSKDTDPSSVRRNRAIFKLLCAERDNEATEDRLLMTDPDFNILPGVTYHRFVDWCQRLIVEIIGELPPEEPDVRIGAFSGGASTSRPRTRSQAAAKYYGKAHVTKAAWDHAIYAIGSQPAWLSATSPVLDLEIVEGNVLFTVPKKTDIDRCAAKEPDLNMYIQKGIGTFFRQCLRRIGINLNDQSINRSLARQGSLDGSLATLDLSSASDSVSRELVFQFLPIHWFTLLDDVRSPVTVHPDGYVHRNSMFSNMGNGFTFELQSLLFYSILRGVAYFTGTPGIVSVYGDDLIIPTEMASLAIFTLNYFGFQVNPDKSFVDGPFRESCGGHYYNGFDITPFYVKAPLERITDVIDVANKLRQWGSPAPDPTWSYPIINTDVEKIWLWLKGFIPSYLWGGRDLSFKYQLVSHDTPRNRLHEESDPVVAGPGGYPLWLSATRARTALGDPDYGFDPLEEALETSAYSRSRNRLRLLKVRDTTVTRPQAWFVHELG